MKGEHRAAARGWVQVVGELRLDPSGFVTEGQRQPVIGQPLRQIARVLQRLGLDAGQGVSPRLGLDHADSSAVGVEHVIGLAGLEGKLADRYTLTSRKIHAVVVLYCPAGGFKLAVDLLAGSLFGRWHKTQGGLNPGSLDGSYQFEQRMHAHQRA